MHAHIFALIKTLLTGAAPGALASAGSTGRAPTAESKIRQVGNRQLRKLQEACDLRKHAAREVNKLLVLSASRFFTGAGREHSRGRDGRQEAGGAEGTAQALGPRLSLLAPWMCVTLSQSIDIAKPPLPSVNRITGISSPWAGVTKEVDSRMTGR